MTEEIIIIFPNSIQQYLREFDNFKCIHEIRVKAEKPLIFSLDRGEKVLDYKVTVLDIKEIMQRISNYSLYAFEEEIKQGFITIKGGHRVGIAGECVMDKDGIKTIKNISSLNVRICREVKGCAKELVKELVYRNNVYNTIIISPPKCGKTTMLRDIARIISTGMYTIGLEGKKVVVVDERSEIGGSYLGIPQMDVGIRTDILDNCTKREGMMLAIRSLSPEVIICDEIGSKGDVESLLMAFNSGVNIIVTVHGYDIEDLYKRDVFKELLNNNIVERVVVLSNREGVGTIEGIYNLGGGSRHEYI